MEQLSSTNEPTPSHVPFNARPASVNWEPYLLVDSLQLWAWVWFKPTFLPQGLVVKIPDETYQKYPQRHELTLRSILDTVGIEPSQVLMWYLYGTPCESQNGTNPLLDQAIPDPPAGVDPNIHICMQVAQPHAVPAVQPPPLPQPTAHSSTNSHRAADLFELMESDWQASTKIEKDLTVRRKQLVDMANRLNTLNRDLSSEERMHADNQDKAAWQDARRWMRDVAARVSRYIKEQDMGETTYAGKKKWIQQIYQDYVEPRRDFDGMEQAQREFESYRKMVQTLLGHMHTAYSNAAQDGERRAQQVLSQIASKARRGGPRK